MSIDHNRDVFDSARVAASYVEYAGPTDGFLDRGEAAALVAAAGVARGTPVLDVGVGSGRTTAMLRLMSESYVAIDYAPTMVDAFRRNFPDMQAHVADARNLKDFADGEFGLIVFSNNGIDTVTHEERRLVLAEFHRVLGASGVLVFSTLNRNGPSFGETPFQLSRPTQPFRFSPKRAATAIGRRLLDPAGVVLGVRNWWSAKNRVDDRGAWAIAPLAAHDFAPFMHFTTVPDARTLVTEAGFTVARIFADDGSVVDPDTVESSADNFTILARK
ncbi:S-adenosyl-L-methionine-dependent methyltransferase [Rhodococcus sp. AW25M09]|uniref:class I SAM-dependent methyltransferase n=1 Tax=Rhodococcus sp. AW25M09 TaxID=1268303 RepID=UPI0002AC2C87|nr:class I SAM-dependent methyltransferase [Rhodococcus sp. AW25M09]CCQ17920.1 S-adenosyl-L-methionine-dependent methyltransferase [Rhodococcus sp. AW25M09]